MSRLASIRTDSRAQARRAQKRATKQARRTRKRLEPVARDVRGGAATAAESARDWAAPRVEAAVDWATPRVETAVDKVRDEVLPKVTEAVVGALAATEPARKEAKVRGTAAVAALKGELEPPPSRRRRFGRLLLLLGAAGAAVAGWSAWSKARSSGAHAGSPWAAPAPGVRPTTMTTAPATPTVVDLGATGSDAAGSSPDEALADAVEEASEEEAESTKARPRT